MSDIADRANDLVSNPALNQLGAIDSERLSQIAAFDKMFDELEDAVDSGKIDEGTYHQALNVLQQRVDEARRRAPATTAPD